MIGGNGVPQPQQGIFGAILFLCIFAIVTTRMQYADVIQQARSSVVWKKSLKNVSVAALSQAAEINNNASKVTELFTDNKQLKEQQQDELTGINFENDESSSCFQFNSKEWLEGHRIGNIPIPEHDLDQIMKPHQLLVQAHLDTVLGQTLCYPSGQFLNISMDATSGWNSSNADQVRNWEFRLLYLAIHRLHHQAAFEEYQARQACRRADHTTNTTWGTIQNFDYECRKAKFWVIVVNTRAGMGTVFRNSVMPSLFMAIAMGRVPLLVQSVKAQGQNLLPDPMTQHFPLASCERGDWQCVFMPTSPCVLTVEDIYNATILSDDDVSRVRQHGNLTQELAGHRVLVHLSNIFTPFHVGDAVNNQMISKVYEVMQELLNDWKTDNNEDNITSQPWEVLTQAAESFRHFSPDPVIDAARKWRYTRVAFFYLFRPNPWAKQEIHEWLSEALPSSNSLSGPQQQQPTYIGLPIRGSDKCRFESTCLTFDRYMELALLKWQEHNASQGTLGKILLTSEDPKILPMRLAYTQNSSFPLDFAVIPKDVQQGHGRPKRYKGIADAVMISSLSAIKLQLQANILVGNCCSNFHNLLFDMVREGCGADPKVQFQCLSEDGVDRKFRICCSRSMGSVCAQVRAEHNQARANAVAAARTAEIPVNGSMVRR